MKQQTMIVLFYLNKAKTNQKGVCPIYCRITFLKKRKQFSTGQFVNPKHWNSKAQRVLSKDVNYNYINGQLSLIAQKLNNTFLKLQLQQDEFNVGDISNLYFGWGRMKEDTLVSYYNKYLAKISKLIGKDIKEPTYKKFEYVKGFLESFIQFKFKTKDIALKRLELLFLDDLEYYLKTERNLGQATINKIIQRLRRPIKEAVSEGYLDKDPFMLYKAKTIKTRVVFLSPEELQIFENFTFTQPKLQLVKDLFIFCCYTGLAYNELSRLERKHIQKGFDDMFWISMKREKTSKAFSIPLLPQAESLINKYQSKESLVFPKISNQKYNSYLKEIGAIIGIEKKLTTHIARKTFASTVLLYNDVPMEIVSELLGHSSMKITQDSYGNGLVYET
ncbi:MAG: integrase/recombinase XerD [bacterium]|jgi:integrase/recombinase XerD